jgi:heat shock protein HspQ
MARVSDLPHLLTLLEDDDLSTRTAICGELLSFGNKLDEELSRLDPPMTPQQRFLVNALVEPKCQRPESPTGAFNARFPVGRIVRHKTQLYRGVIVSSDPMCLADKEWYFANRSQPDIHQAWYHVLVDESWAITYAAENNLIFEHQPGLISHPVISLYFNGFRGGTYLRNSRPWLT